MRKRSVVSCVYDPHFHSSFFPVNVAGLKKVKLQVEALHSAKLKDEKAAKSKKPGKGGRTTVKMDLDKVRPETNSFETILLKTVKFHCYKLLQDRV